MTDCSQTQIYLDYNATAPMLPAALDVMIDAARDVPGNPSSPHRHGQEARGEMERSRGVLARHLGFERREVFFNSGGSEGNNTILAWLGGLPPPVHLITSPIEHPSVLRACETLQARGVAVSMLPVDGEGRIAAEAVPGLMRPETRMVSVMAANNETGVIQPLAEIAAAVRTAQTDRPVLIHTDAVQAFGRIELFFREWEIDAATVTAHKLGGPKGIGALAVRSNWNIGPLITGGSQERGRRAGTESVPLASGFRAAAELVFGQMARTGTRLLGLRERLIANVAGVPGFFLNGSDAVRLPNTLNLGFAGVGAQSLVTALDLEGISVSSGSACSSGSIEPSHVLTAMGAEPNRIGESIRISMGHATSEAEIDRCAGVLHSEVRRIRDLGIRGRATA